MQPLLRSERLVFRRVALSDVDDLVILNADQDVMRFIDWQPPSPEEVTAEVKELVSAYNRYPDLGRYVAENSKGEFLGWFGLRVTSSGPRIPELGFRLRRLSWGQGLATRLRSKTGRRTSDLVALVTSLLTGDVGFAALVDTLTAARNTVDVRYRYGGIRLSATGRA